MALYIANMLMEHWWKLVLMVMKLESRKKVLLQLLAKEDWELKIHLMTYKIPKEIFGLVKKEQS